LHTNTTNQHNNYKYIPLGGREEWRMMKFEARRRKELRIRLQRAEMRIEREEVER
jgi:hypothetical protein